MATKKEKGRQWDGISRPSDDKYRENFDRIFGKKVKDDEEITGYYINGYDPSKSKLLTKKKEDVEHGHVTKDHANKEKDI